MTSRDANIQNIYLRQCRFLEKRYPALLALGVPVSPANAAAAFDIYCWHVKHMDPVAAVQDRVRFCTEMLTKTPDPALRRKLFDDLFELQASRGMPHRVLPLLPEGDLARAQVDALQSEHAAHYGYDLRRFDMKGSDRGHALRFYFSENANLLKGRRVLHVAPEAGLRAWMVEAARAHGFQYATADGFMEGVDHHIDLCAMPFDDGVFDLIIIHRVLEHVIDNAGALSELARILAPGGMLNVSVPEALYMGETSEWRVPDPDVHYHFRVYGRDFPDMLTAAGFDPGRCDWLLRQSETRLKLFGAYPMLFYNAVKR